MTGEIEPPSKEELAYDLATLKCHLDGRVGFSNAADALTRGHHCYVTYGNRTLCGQTPEQEGVYTQYLFNPVDFVQLSQRSPERFCKECLEHPDLPLLYLAEL